MSRAVLVLLAVAGAGCAGKPPPGPPDTGSKGVVETFFGGLSAGDPARAYAALDPDSKRRVSSAQFAVMARAYDKRLGFPAEHVHVRSCEEQGDTAIAHVSLQGRSGGHTRRYNDGVTLHRTDGHWGVVLPANFGQPAR